MNNLPLEHLQNEDGICFRTQCEFKTSDYLDEIGFTKKNIVKVIHQKSAFCKIWDYNLIDTDTNFDVFPQIPDF